MQESFPSIQYQCRRHRATLTLYSEITVSSAFELQQTMLLAVMEPKIKDICIDLTGVERIDIAALQLFLAFKSECIKAGRTFKVQGIPPTVASLIAQIGIQL